MCGGPKNIENSAQTQFSQIALARPVLKGTIPHTLCEIATRCVYINKSKMLAESQKMQQEHHTPQNHKQIHFWWTKKELATEAPYVGWK